jgi:hypothetical protein
MKHWTTTKATDVTGVTTALLAVECTTYDEDEQPSQWRLMPLNALLRGLSVSLPRPINAKDDRLGAI